MTALLVRAGGWEDPMDGVVSFLNCEFLVTSIYVCNATRTSYGMI